MALVRGRQDNECRSIEFILVAFLGKKRCRMHRGALGSGAPRGNKNAFKHDRFTREAIAERAHIRELVRQALKLLLQIE